MCGEFFESINAYGEHQNRFCSKKCSFDYWYSQNKKPPTQGIDGFFRQAKKDDHYSEKILIV